MEPLFLPVLHSFENNNIFTGSYGKLRFRVTPNIVMLTQKEVNFDESSMNASILCNGVQPLGSPFGRAVTAGD